MVVVTFPKPKDGSSFPARVFAILPQARSSSLSLSPEALRLG